MKAEPLWTRNFIIIIIANLLFFLSFQMVVPILPLYIESLGGSSAMVGLIVACGTVGGVLARPFAGRLTDSWGRLPVYFIGLTLCALAIFIYPFCTALIVLLLVRFMHGLCMGTATTGNSTIATDLLPRSRLNEGIGYFGMASTLALTVAPALALYMITVVDYGSVFRVAFGISVLTVVLSLLLLVKPPPSIPVNTNREALYEKSALLPALLLAFQSCSYASIATYLALYGVSLAISNIGLYFSVYAVTIVVCRLFVGRIADRRGYHVVMIPALIAGPLSFVFLAWGQQLGTLLISAVLMGISFGISFPTLMAMAVRDVAPQRRGAANGTVMSGFDLGFGLGAMVWGMVAQWLGYSAMYLLNLPFLALSLIIYLWWLRSARNAGRHRSA
ncbi:MAG: MFS transporter [Syntrophomonadaceae bacterium]|nr:MFS transporter [Syntrophomonadaceae bacterium]